MSWSRILCCVFFVVLIASAARPEMKGTVPIKAYVVLTIKHMGCLVSQKIKVELTPAITKDDGQTITFWEIKNPEDIEERNELYLVFQAKVINDLPGFYLLKLWCESDTERSAFCTIDYASLLCKDNGWAIKLRVKSDGFLRAQLLYSRNPGLRQAWFSCPEADLRKPVCVTFFQAYPLPGELGGLPMNELANGWQDIELIPQVGFLETAVAIDGCEYLLEKLNARFGSAEQPFVWHQQKVKRENIQAMVTKTGRMGKNFCILLRADDGINIRNVENSFDPHLRQKLALLGKQGDLVGAELWLRMD